ncbi:MAG TPA: alpha/beta hydrolase [Thermoanaerobaculia bacterium]|jgi:pimeloyl-ACP methyl ester carboxylesterase
MGRTPDAPEPAPAVSGVSGSRRMKVVRILLAALAAGVLLFLAVMFAIWRRPITTLDALARAGLRLSGFRQSEIAGPRGRLSLYTGGAGTPVVLLHGVNDTVSQWASVAGEISAGHRVILPELAGHGRSEPREGTLTVGDLLAGVDAVLLREAPDGPITLVGASIGGWVALLWALEHPERTRAVILVNGVALSQFSGVVNMLPTTREEARRMLDALTGPAAPKAAGFFLDDVARRSADSPLARLMRTSYAPWLLDDRLAQVRAPVVLIWGDEDELLPYSYAREVARRLPQARLVDLPGCGHVPARECPGLLLPALKQAIDAPSDVSGP